MTLINRWVAVPERIGPKIPELIKALLIPWFVLGMLLVAIPELRIMPAVLRFVLLLPVFVGVLYMAIGSLLMLADKIIALASFVRRHAGKSS